MKTKFRFGELLLMILVSWVVIYLCAPVHAATVWNDQPGLYKQQKSNAVKQATRYVPLTEAQVKVIFDAMQPVVTPPVVIIPPVVTPPITTIVSYPEMPSMPSINTALIPTRFLGYPTVRLDAATQTTADSPDDQGAFRLWCDYSHMNFDDAIVYPGQQGKSHLHTYFGNTGADYSSSNESLRTTGNSTCHGGIINRSAYWVPAMIDTATNTPLKPEHLLLYYKHSTVEKFPSGLRMISGSMLRNTSVANSWERHQWFECNEVYDGHKDNIPACSGRLTMGVAFPECWNGVDLDSANHQSHMAYSENGVCPATHPHKLPTLWMIVHYIVNSDTANWRLSSDMYAKNGFNSGFSAHADVITGWDEAIEQKWIDNCINAKRDCHADLLGNGQVAY
jgi:hypothetical protein